VDEVSTSSKYWPRILIYIAVRSNIAPLSC